jgi:hypothetical protein
MANKPVSVTTYEKRIVDDVFAGRLQAAVSAILALPKKQAVVVEAHVLYQVRDSSYYGGLLQVLESYFDD